MSYKVWADLIPQHWNWDAESILVNINVSYKVNIFISMFNEILSNGIFDGS